MTKGAMSYQSGFRLAPTPNKRIHITNLKNCLEQTMAQCVDHLNEESINKVCEAVEDMDSVWEVYNGL